MNSTTFTPEADGSIRHTPAASVAEISIPNAESAKHEIYATITVEGYGDIELTLDQKAAPVTVANFVKYVEAGHYNDTIFHRVIPGFMIQGGGFDEKMTQKPTGAAIPNEAQNKLKNKKFTIAMARTSDPHSATAQFFINLADNAFLDNTGTNPQNWGYAVFGEVTSGQDVVEKIAQVKTGRRGFHDDVPRDVVKIAALRIEGEAVGTHLAVPAGVQIVE